MYGTKAWLRAVRAAILASRPLGRRERPAGLDCCCASIFLVLTVSYAWRGKACGHYGHPRRVQVTELRHGLLRLRHPAGPLRPFRTDAAAGPQPGGTTGSSTKLGCCGVWNTRCTALR